MIRYLKGKPFDAATLEGALPILDEDCKVTAYVAAAVCLYIHAGD